MPVSIEHEAPLELLERFPDLLPSLLREQFGRPVPLGARLRPVSENHNITVAQEFRSDSAVVLEVTPGQPPVCAAILEPQRSIDPNKWYSWPRPDGPEVAYRTLRAVYELHGLDMFVWLYYLIRGVAPNERFADIERLIMLDTQTHFIPKTAFEREQYSKAKSEGQAEGRAEGKAEAVLAVLAARGLAVTADQRSRLLACTDAAKLDQLISGAVFVVSVAGLLADL